MQKGRVIKTYNSFYYIQSLSEVCSELIVCKLRGRFKKQHKSVVTGDEVGFELLPDHTGIIEERFARRNLLRRPAVANIDQVLLTFAAVQPDLHPLLLNRFLVMAEWSGIPEIVICVNKMDLLPAAQAEKFLSLYEKAGYRVLRVSARDRKGIEVLEQQHSGRVSVFAGPSCVGKSSLLNAIDAKLCLATGQISDKIKRGRHTTRIAQLLPFSGGFVADTPGFSSLELEKIDPQDLAVYFPEFRAFLGACRYHTCTHSHEPQCAIKQAVADGKLSSERYEAYLNILAEINERKKDYES